MMDEDWKVLTSLFPPDWEELAVTSGALKGLRKHKSAEDLLRTLLIHLGCGYSLRETVVRARAADLADLSDVALLKRLKKSKEWLRALCLSLFAERNVNTECAAFPLMRLFDATHISEPGKTGSLWRVHYSIQIPSLQCDYFKLTPSQGEGTGESFCQYPIESGDYILADCAFRRFRPPIPKDSAHLFRRIPPTCSEGFRAPIPKEDAHRFRRSPAVARSVARRVFQL